MNNKKNKPSRKQFCEEVNKMSPVITSGPVSFTCIINLTIVTAETLVQLTICKSEKNLGSSSTMQIDEHALLFK